MKSLLTLNCILLFAASYADEDLRYPQHVHLSLGDEPFEIKITWTTFASVSNSMCEYSTGTSRIWTKFAPATESVFVDGGTEHRKLYIQRASMTDLKPGVKYRYHVGSDEGGWSDMFIFSGPRSNDTAWSPIIALYGDLGNGNSVSMAALQEEAQLGTIDMILHNGDFAYNLEDDNGRKGDAFMSQIEAIAGYIPYMTSPGNHEAAYNFSNYRARFTMPNAQGDGQGLWYSFDYGPAHVISISTEVYYYLSSGIQLIAEQRMWLENDLKKANANRAQRPWIMVQGHRPMYCSNAEHDDCTYWESITRYALEDLLYNAGVDILIWAHEHSFERAWPVYNRKVCNGSLELPYTEPRAPVHLTTGSAGCTSRHDPFTPEKPEWSAFRALNYGYTRMKIFNSTHVGVQQVDTEQGGKVIDEIMIIKLKQGPDTYTCHL